MVSRLQKATNTKVTTRSRCILWSYQSSVLQGLKHTLLLSFKCTHTHTHAHTSRSPQKHTGYVGTQMREGAFIWTSFSNTPTPFLVLHCLFHTIISFSHPHTPFYSVEILPPPLTLLPHVRMNFAWICRPPSHPRAPRAPCTSNFTLLYKLQCPPVSKLWIVFKVCKPVMICSLYVKY